MLIWGISKLQGGDEDKFDAKYQDFPNSTIRVPSAWIESGCRRNAEHIAHNSK